MSCTMGPRPQRQVQDLKWLWARKVGGDWFREGRGEGMGAEGLGAGRMGRGARKGFDDGAGSMGWYKVLFPLLCCSRSVMVQFQIRGNTIFWNLIAMAHCMIHHRGTSQCNPIPITPRRGFTYKVSRRIW